MDRGEHEDGLVKLEYALATTELTEIQEMAILAECHCWRCFCSKYGVHSRDSSTRCHLSRGQEEPSPSVRPRSRYRGDKDQRSGRNALHRHYGRSHHAIRAYCHVLGYLQWIYVWIGKLSSAVNGSTEVLTLGSCFCK